MKPMVVVLAAILAMVLGTGAALFGGWIGLILVALVIAIGWVLCDYRAGVVLLAFMLPFSASPLLPGLKGFNTFNYLMAATLFAFLVHKLFSRARMVWPPRIFWWCFVLPLCVAVLVGMGHLGEVRQGAVLADTLVDYQPGNYLRRLMFSLFFVAYAIMLANAVKESRRPERFIGLLCAAAVLPTLAIAGAIVASGLDLSALQGRRDFLSKLGLHANEFGMLLAIVCGPLLYLTASLRGAPRAGAAVAFGLVLAGLLLTFSRGAYIALFVVLMIFLYERRRIRVIIVSMLAGAAILIAGPAAFRERLTTGADPGTLARAEAGVPDDPLTAGRIGIYYMLVPEVARSPLWGRGAGSTVWTNAAKSGRYMAGHPHNMYLEILLDVGLLGFAVLMYLYARYFGALRRLATSEQLSPTLRAYFGGAAASFAGMLVMGLSNGHWMAHPEQAFLWFALGMAFAWWPLQDTPRQAAEPAKRGLLRRGPAAGARRGSVAWVPGRYR